jgi:glycosyltransferase involved in cell wall biosynthesis
MLVFFHCHSNTGYAIERLERAFLEAARRVVGNDGNIHFAYPDLSGGHPRVLPTDFSRVIQFDSASTDPADSTRIERYVRDHGIDVALGMDQPVRRPGHRALRKGGVQSMLSYWGASMSDLNRGWKLALKRLDVRLAPAGPDHYIFESFGMQRTAVEGRGIPRSRTSVTRLGVDLGEFRLPQGESWYAHDTFGIPHDRRIVYYSGHMEERKGVRVIVNAAVDLVERQGRRDVHFLLLGNAPGEAERFDPLYRDTSAREHITFGGYRTDSAKIIPCGYLGAIASTGWDSFPMSSLEMAACGLPLLVSDLPGLNETVADGETGFTFPIGDHLSLSRRIASFLDDPRMRESMSAAARTRIEREFTLERQYGGLAETVRRVRAARGGTDV